MYHKIAFLFCVVLVVLALTLSSTASAAGLVGWWTFDETSGTTAKDSSGKGNNGRIVGTPQWVPGKVGGALQFNGSTYVDCGNGPSLNVREQITIAFWFNFTSLGIGFTRIVEYGPVSFEFDEATSALYGYDTTADGERQLIGVAVFSGWSFVYIRRTASSSRFGYQFSGALFEVGVDVAMLPFTPDDDKVTAKASATSSAAFGIHDLRLWNVCKSVAELTSIRDYAPVPTAVNYRLSKITTVDRANVYGFEVLPNGWAVPGRLPAWNRTVGEARIIRYNSAGSYIGPAAFEEVGIGANVAIPGQFVPGAPDYQLGYVFPFGDSTGTIPMAGTSGVYPGTNTFWANDTVGDVIIQLSGGYTVNGSVAVAVPVSSPVWPPNELQLNTAVEKTWVKGDNSGVYCIRLMGNAGTTWLAADAAYHVRGEENISVSPVFGALLATGTYWNSPISATLLFGTIASITNGVVNTQINLGSLTFDYQLTDAPTALTAASKGLRVAATGSSTGVPYVGAVASTKTTPPLWLYLYERTAQDAIPAWGKWIGGGVGYDGSLFGNKPDLHPDVPEQVPALAMNGQLDFENESALPVGWYRLSIDAGNIGRTDPAFDGLSIEFSLNGSAWTQVNLLAGLSGYNIRDTTPVEFYLSEAVSGPWLLSIRWINAFSDFQHKVQRQLVVYNYSIQRLAGELWKVSLAGNSLVYTNATPSAGTLVLSSAGGWFQQYRNSGSIVPLSHEVLTYSTTA